MANYTLHGFVSCSMCLCQFWGNFSIDVDRF
jgi:hypothetical protein